MKLPHGPKIPRWLQLIQWIANPVSYMEVGGERYGDIFTGVIGIDAQPRVIVSNPQALKQILSQNPQEFTAPGELSKIFAPIMGNYGVSMLDGDRYQRERRMLMPPFHGERMRAYGELICILTQQVSRKWITGQPFSVRESMQEISLRVILQVVFGIHEGSRYEQLRQLLVAFLDMTNSPLGATKIFS